MVHIHNRIHKAVSVGFQDWCHFPTLTKLTLGAVYQKCELAMVHKELMQCVALACWVMAWSIQLTTPSRMWWCRHLHGSLDTTSSPLSCTGTVSLPVAPLLECWCFSSRGGRSSDYQVIFSMWAEGKCGTLKYEGVVSQYHHYLSVVVERRPKMTHLKTF